MADFANGKIQAFVGPSDLDAADNLEEVIVAFINGAQKSLEIAIQELDSEPIAQAILDARLSGISVRMVVEQDYLISGRRLRIRPKKDESKEEAKLRQQWTESRRPITVKTNRDIMAALLRSDVDVKADYNSKIFHQKFIIRDFTGSAQPTSAVLTGSTNFTHTGTHKNLNNVLIFHDERICRTYRDEFAEIRSGMFGTRFHEGAKQDGPINIDGVPVRILFAPDDAPELEIVKQMLKCEQSLDFAVFTFSGSSGIDDAMITLREAGRELRGVLDSEQGRQDWAATTWLHDKGVRVFFPKKRPGLGKLHHKLMVIDDNIVIAGSMNYTRPANEFNDENVYVIGSPYNDLPVDKGGPVDDQECAAIANYFRAEIERIIQDSDPFTS